jgi:hypothetical protein
MVVLETYIDRNYENVVIFKQKQKKAKRRQLFNFLCMNNQSRCSCIKVCDKSTTWEIYMTVI